MCESVLPRWIGEGKRRAGQKRKRNSVKKGKGAQKKRRAGCQNDGIWYQKDGTLQVKRMENDGRTRGQRWYRRMEPQKENARKNESKHFIIKNFSSEIKKKNFQKIKCIPFMGSSYVSDGHDSRTRALEYSRTVPRPALVAGTHCMDELPRSSLMEHGDELERLNQLHD